MKEYGYCYNIIIVIYIDKGRCITFELCITCGAWAATKYTLSHLTNVIEGA